MRLAGKDPMRRGRDPTLDSVIRSPVINLRAKTWRNRSDARVPERPVGVHARAQEFWLAPIIIVLSFAGGVDRARSQGSAVAPFIYHAVLSGGPEHPVFTRRHEISGRWMRPDSVADKGGSVVRIDALSYPLAFVATVVLLYVLKRLAPRIDLVDNPGGHRWHETATPLVGGLAMFLGFLFGVLTLDIPLAPLRSFFAAAALLIVVGVLEIICTSCRPICASFRKSQRPCSWCIGAACCCMTWVH